MSYSILNVIAVYLCLSSLVGSGVEAVQPWAVPYPDTKSNSLCLLARFTARLYSKDNTQDNIVLDLSSASVTQITANGECNNDTHAILQLQWTGNENWTQLTIRFGKHDDNLVVERIAFEGKNEVIFSEELGAFSVRAKYGYKCSHTTNITSDSKKFDLLLSDVQWEIGRDKDDKHVSDLSFIKTPKKCDSDVELNKSMPIIAGVVMGCLVVVVVGFLIFGRFRFRRIDDKY